MKLALLIAIVAAAANAEPITQNLWPATSSGPASKTDGEERDLTKPEDKLIVGRRIIKLGHVSAPQMQVLLPAKDKANGAAVLVCPGGGFTILAWDLEGTEVAEWLNGLGFAAIVVKYRVPTREHGDTLAESVNNDCKASLMTLGPLMDAQRTMSLTRAHAKEWGIDPKRIGILGFSAGGAIAALNALNGDKRAYAKLDAADDQSCAPNFALLIYPGALVDKESGALKPWLHADNNAPPMFFAMAQDDPVNSDNCTALFSELKRAKVPAEMHIYTHGGHGYGLRPTEQPVTRWPQRAEEWLKDMGFTGAR